MIPKILHRFWLGPKPIPPEYECYWQSWLRQHPDWTCITWRDQDVVDYALYPQIQAAQSYAVKADIARMEIILKMGGFYVDCDFECFRRIDQFCGVPSGLVVCNDSDQHDLMMDNAWFGATIGHPAIQAMFDHFQKLSAEQLMGASAVILTGPHQFRKGIGHHPAALVATSLFYPYNYHEAFSRWFYRDTQLGFGIHYYASSWNLPDQYHRILFSNAIEDGFLAEARKQLGVSINITERQDVEAKKRLDEAVKERLQIFALDGTFMMKFAKELDLPAVKSRLTRPEWHLQKLCRYLCEVHEYPEVSSPLQFRQLPNIVQIGAGNGLSDDVHAVAIRGILCRFDPPAVLIESSNQFAQLKANYARNQNITYLDKMIFPDPQNQMSIKTEAIFTVDQSLRLTDLAQLLPEQAIDILIINQVNNCAFIAELDLMMLKTKILCIQSDDAEVLSTLSTQFSPNYIIGKTNVANVLLAIQRDMIIQYCQYLAVYHGYSIDFM